MKKVNIGEVARISVGLNVRTSDIQTGYFLVTPSGIEDGKVIKFQNAELISKKSDDEIGEYLLHKNDILLQSKGNKFEVILIDKEYEKLLPSTFYFRIRTNNNINTKYLQWLLRSKEAQEYFEKNTSGNVIKTIRKSIVENLEIMLPPKKKQDKIAKIISVYELEKEHTERYLALKKEYISQKINKNYGGVHSGIK